jgi:O-antigen ligase
VIGVLLISTITALYAAVWLKPGMVLATAIMHVIAVAVVLWQLAKEPSTVDWKKLLKRNWFLLPFVVYAFLSILWSTHWNISLYRWVILVSTLILGWYFGRKYTRKDFETILLLFAVLMLMLSVVVTVIDFNQANELPGRLRGIFWQKNHTGLFMSLISLLCFVNYVDNFQVRNAQFYLSCGLFIASIAVIVLNNSTAAMLSTLIMHGIVLAIMLWLHYKPLLNKNHYFFVGGAAVLALIAIVFNLDFVFGLFGRNASLTGRVPMWEQLFKLYFSQRSWLGYGFNAFWYQPSHRMVVGTVSYLPDILISDNGFIDILINNGVVGFILFLVFYTGLWIRSIQSVLKAKTVSDFSSLLIMISIFLGNLTWSMLFENESMYMLIMIVLLFSKDTNQISEHR